MCTTTLLTISSILEDNENNPSVPYRQSRTPAIAGRGYSFLLPNISARSTARHQLLHPLIVEFPRFITTSYFDWPDTKEGREVLQTWWEKSGKNIGVKVLPSIFMRGLSYHVLLFNDKFSIGFVDGGSEINYGSYHWRRSNQYDKVLYEYMIRVCETQKKLSTEEGKRRVKEFHSHFLPESKI